MRVSSTNTIKVMPIIPSHKVKKDKPRMKDIAQMEAELDWAYGAVCAAEEHGLSAEVFRSAIQHAQANPRWSFNEVVDAACNEWDI